MPIAGSLCKSFNIVVFYTNLSVSLSIVGGGCLVSFVGVGDMPILLNRSFCRKYLISAWEKSQKYSKISKN